MHSYLYILNSKTLFPLKKYHLIYIASQLMCSDQWYLTYNLLPVWSLEGPVPDEGVVPLVIDHSKWSSHDWLHEHKLGLSKLQWMEDVVPGASPSNGIIENVV